MTLPIDQNIANKVVEALSTVLGDKINDTNTLLARLLDQGKPSPEPPEWATSMIKTLININVTMSSLVVAMGGKVKLENPPFVATRKKTVTTAGTAEQLPNVKIPYGHEVTIIALEGNSTGIIYVGNSKLEAEDLTTSLSLLKTEFIEYKIRNLEQLWINSDTDGIGVVWTVEQAET